MFGKTVKSLAAKVPEHRNSTYVAQAIAAAGIAVPVVSYALPQATLWLPQPLPLIAEAGVGLAAVGLEALIFSKLAVKNRWNAAREGKPARKLEVTLGGMTFDEKSLFTNLIAFGTIGSGKTAGVVYPVLEAITSIYNNDDPTMPDAKWGGFVLDVKGDFHQAVIYTMEKHGRDLLSDLVVIRPDNDYYVLEFEEVTTKEHFLVSCTGGTSMQECDAVLARAEGPDAVLGTDLSRNKVLRLPNGDTEPLSSFVFSDRGVFRRTEIHKLLEQLKFDVRGLSVRWLGWREDKNGRLVRVTHTHKRQVQFKRGQNGQLVTVNKPERLRYLGVHSINNGLTYNLISKNAASTEAAGRIMAVAEVTGNAFGNDNAYWSNASEKHITACIELFRQVEGPLGKECSVNEIQKFTTNENYLAGYIGKLKDVIKEKAAKGAGTYEILLLRNLDDYFTGEWLRHDPKMRGNIQSCVTNLFGDVTRNEQLIKTFCQPSRFSFEDCLNEGKVYTLVLNAYPNAQMLIGTCMKLDFQQVVLKRTQAAPVNKQRFLMFLADEYQYFITTSGGGKTGGDEKFLSVARQSRIFNFVCTQAKTSLLAVQKDENKIDAFIQCFGSRVYLQNLCSKTNKMAEENLGQFWGEKEDHSGADLKISSAFSEGKSGSVTRRQEKMNRFEASHFTQMAPFEAVIFNKERPPDRKIAKANLRETACFWDTKELSRAANSYYQAYIENRANQLGISHLFDPKDNVKLEASRSETEQRKQGILRSWRNGTPLGAPIVPDTTDSQTAPARAEPESAAGEEDQQVDEQTTDTGREAMRQELGFLPPFEVLKDYNNKQPQFHSDLQASKDSDPFYAREEGKVVATPEGEATSPAEPPAPESFEETFGRNLSQLLLEAQLPLEAQQPTKPGNRTLSNLTSVPEIPMDGPAAEAAVPAPAPDAATGPEDDPNLAGNEDQKPPDQRKAPPGQSQDYHAPPEPPSIK